MIALDQVALIMDEIDEDPRLTSLIDERAIPEANEFRQRVRDLRRRAQQSDRAGVTRGLTKLQDACEGPLRPWRDKVQSAAKLLASDE